MATKVIFRVWRRSHDVIALFPAEAADIAGRYCCSYEHVGQHGAACYEYVVTQSRLATPGEYAELLAELVCIGCDDLVVVRKCAPQDRATRRAQYNQT